ncbi:uncharacterized protein LOC122869731 [Siniperca chuatsi]|uniref:uncharacterized protein LOC122869731 n=1 Tax=Siniperca chuatsi TaxID=119488 RepID=UPI001CE0B2D1|nr:uncharacterized protein LOC122869731 [Siniperca chuatsi]
MNGSQCIWILNGILLMLTSVALAGNLLQNVALNQNAIQSSQNGSAAAGRAIDGNRDPSFKSGSCSLTNEESDPWWRVDLQNVYKITAVMITNRDEQENWLNGAEIWIGNSMETNTKNIRCAVISHIPSGRTLYFSCGATEGRYVTVLLPGSHKVLSLCEVEVFPVNYAHPLANVALKGDATQSSTLSFAAASKAIDGRRNSYYSRGFCSHTAEDETNPWWRVDLRWTYIVTSVKVTNRGDCCAERLDGAEIRIGNSQENNGNNNPRCASISHIRAGKTYTYHCDGGSMEGRFVNVIIPGKSKTLTLCEVEVYAAPAVEPLPNVALNRPTAQSSILPFSNSKASNPVSGCRSGLFKCCSHTIMQSNPWWRVDLLAVHKVRAVTIVNRKDCCSERLLGAQILIGNSQQHDDNKNLRCGIISSEMGTSVHTFQCADMEGRYVIVIIPGLFKILTLCEVEVYASMTVPDVVTSPPPTAPPPPTVSMQLSGRNVTMVGERLCWSDALFYCRRHHWDLLSLRSQEEQSEVEQLLSRSPFPLTDFVWLGLRRDIMRDRWFWMSGDSMKFTKWPRDLAPHRYSNPCGGMARGKRFLWEHQPCAKLLNFICLSGAEDRVQRVYFYSTREVLSED